MLKQYVECKHPNEMQGLYGCGKKCCFYCDPECACVGHCIRYSTMEDAEKCPYLKENETE